MIAHRAEEYLFEFDAGPLDLVVLRHEPHPLGLQQLKPFTHFSLARLPSQVNVLDLGSDIP